MSWDSEGADKPFTGCERYARNTIETAAAQVASEALHSVRRLVAEQQKRPMKLVARSLAALHAQRILNLGRFLECAVECRQFRSVGRHIFRYYADNCTFAAIARRPRHRAAFCESNNLQKVSSFFSSTSTFHLECRKVVLFPQLPRVLRFVYVLTVPQAALMLRTYAAGMIQQEWGPHQSALFWDLVRNFSGGESITSN